MICLAKNLRLGISGHGQSSGLSRCSRCSREKRSRMFFHLFFTSATVNTHKRQNYKADGQRGTEITWDLQLLSNRIPYQFLGLGILVVDDASIVDALVALHVSDQFDVAHLGVRRVHGCQRLPPTFV